MVSPTMAIAPARPWAHAEEDTVVEVAGAVKSDWRAGVGCVVVVAVSAHGLNAQIEDNLGVRCRCQSHDSEQRGRDKSRSKQCFECTHFRTSIRHLRFMNFCRDTALWEANDPATAVQWPQSQRNGICIPEVSDRLPAPQRRSMGGWCEQHGGARGRYSAGGAFGVFSFVWRVASCVVPWLSSESESAALNGY